MRLWGEMSGELRSLLVGDILARPELLQNNYDLISCFRFLLNVEPEMRSRVLQRLREALRAPDGRLLVNIHGNSRSLRHPAIVWRRWRTSSSSASRPGFSFAGAAANRWRSSCSGRPRM